MNPFNDLPPWQGAGLFQTPQQTFYSNPASKQEVAKADPLRVLLMFASLAPTGTQFLVGINPNPATNEGFPLTGAAQALVITWETHGPLVNMPWYNNTQVLGTGYTVLTLSMTSWPDANYSSASKLAFNPPPLAPQQITTAPGVNGGKGLLDYWHRLVTQFGGRK